MKNVINFINKTNAMSNTEINNELITMKSLIESKTTVQVNVSQEEKGLILYLIYNELKVVNSEYAQAVKEINQLQLEYWHTVKTVFTQLIDMLGKVQETESTLTLTLMEFDCILGAIETRLNETILNKLLMLEDENTDVTEKLSIMFKELSVIYDNNKHLFKVDGEIIDLPNRINH